MIKSIRQALLLSMLAQACACADSTNDELDPSSVARSSEIANDADAPSTAGGHVLRATLQAGVDDLHDLGIVGAQAVVRVRGDVIRVRSGVADLLTGDPVPLDGYFRIASTTKTLVSVVALQLVGEGKLCLDDTVERWLPGVVSGNGNDGNAIKVRNLLQHNSGLYNYVDDLTFLASAEGYYQHRFDHFDVAELVAIATSHERLFAPGEHWRYSDTNYILIGMIIQQVTGHPWQVEMQARLLAPLGLRHTFFPGDRPTLPEPHAEIYQQFTPDGSLVDTTLLNVSSADASGGLVSTTTDVSRFWHALQSGQLLGPRQMAQMHDKPVLAETFQELIPHLRYGLGLFLFPSRCGGFWGHPGDLTGVSTYNAVATDGSRAAVLYLTSKPGDPAIGGAATLRALRLMEDVICGPE
jgi:D-alanyl-D-alanine carboxypeptidase